MTALQGLRDRAQLQSGQSILINGASGGIGTYAIQIAKHLGATVTAVCSARNVDLVKSLGADHVIDYTKENFTHSGKVYDVLFDIIGNHPMPDMLRVLKPKGTFVPVGVRTGGPWLGPIPRLLTVLWAYFFASQRVTFFIANINAADLMLMRDLAEQGKVRSVIDSVYTFEETPLAIEHLMKGHARGKVIVAM
jgi:NADPH:quinone reductase-like Zn-dependent oxidoreductase